MIRIHDPQKKEKEEQFEKIEEFFARFRNTDGSLVGGINSAGLAPANEKVLQNVSGTRRT
jgi:predicted HAD superfamily phosphohydrolase